MAHVPQTELSSQGSGTTELKIKMHNRYKPRWQKKCVLEQTYSNK
jgi:hypothetical protein